MLSLVGSRVSVSRFEVGVVSFGFLITTKEKKKKRGVFEGLGGEGKGEKGDLDK